MSALDKIKLTGTDVIKLCITLGSLYSAFFMLKSDIKSLQAEIHEMKAIKELDKQLIAEKIDLVQNGLKEQENKTNEIDKQLFRIAATLPNKIKIEE